MNFRAGTFRQPYQRDTVQEMQARESQGMPAPVVSPSLPVPNPMANVQVLSQPVQMSGGYAPMPLPPALARPALAACFSGPWPARW